MRVEFSAVAAQCTSMCDTSAAPGGWAEQLRQSEADIVRGDTVPAHLVHERLERVAAELEAETIGEDISGR